MARRASVVPFSTLIETLDATSSSNVPHSSLRGHAQSHSTTSGFTLASVVPPKLPSCAELFMLADSSSHYSSHNEGKLHKVWGRNTERQVKEPGFISRGIPGGPSAEKTSSAG